MYHSIPYRRRHPASSLSSQRLGGMVEVVAIQDFGVGDRRCHCSCYLYMIKLPSCKKAFSKAKK